MFKRRTNPNKLPREVNVTQGITYDVDDVMLADIQSATGKELNEITIEDVMWWLEDWIEEDFSGNGILSVTDEKGRIINATL